MANRNAKWNDQFGNAHHQKCVTVNINGEFEQGKTLHMESEWSIEDFLSAASKRLDLFPTAKRIFNADGVEIDDCMMIVDNDLLFLSDGSGFQPPARLGSDGNMGLTEEVGGKANEGDNIGGFRVGKVLGRGAFGEVRMGQHHLTGEKVALKFLRKAEILTIHAAERTATEIQCLGALKHNNIIQLLTQLESPLNVVIVFELMEGGDLYGYLCSRGTTPAQMALPEDEARPLCHQILSAVGYAHNQHICHRDLKLENILLKGVNSLALVKIADFGLSDFYRPGVNKKSYCGTLSFLAPEVFKGTSNAGPPLDIWSMGVILFAILCGRLPFDAHTVGNSDKPRETIIRSKIMACQYKIDEKLGPEAKDLVRRMLKVDPNERASVPEIFNHVWLRPMSNSLVDFSPGLPMGSSAASGSTPNPGATGNWRGGAAGSQPIAIPQVAPKDGLLDSLSQMEEHQQTRGARARTSTLDSETERRHSNQLQDSLDMQVGSTSCSQTPFQGADKDKCGTDDDKNRNRRDISSREAIGDTMDSLLQASVTSRSSPNSSFMADAFDVGVRSSAASKATSPPSFSTVANAAGDEQTQSVIFPSFRLMPLRRNAETNVDCDSDDDQYPATAPSSTHNSPMPGNATRSSLGLAGLGLASSPPTDDKYRRASTGTERKSSLSTNNTTTHTPADSRSITPNSMRGGPSTRGSGAQEKASRNTFGASRNTGSKFKGSVSTTEPNTPVFSSKRYDGSVASGFSPVNGAATTRTTSRDPDSGAGVVSSKRR